MNKKERKGGQLTNSEIEKELERQGRNENSQGYRGSQDTGDEVVREKGSAVQQTDGAGKKPDETTE